MSSCVAGAVIPREVQDATGVSWRFVNGRHEFRLSDSTLWMPLEHAESVTHPARRVAMDDVQAHPTEALA